MSCQATCVIWSSRIPLTEFETSDLESRKVITPFLYEPEASETNTDIASLPEDSEEEDGSERVGSTEWYNMNYNEKIE